MSDDTYPVPVLLVRDDDPRMGGVPRCQVYCDGAVMVVRESDWPVVAEVLARHPLAVEIVGRPCGAAEMADAAICRARAAR